MNDNSEIKSCIFTINKIVKENSCEKEKLGAFNVPFFLLKC